MQVMYIHSYLYFTNCTTYIYYIVMLYITLYIYISDLKWQTLATCSNHFEQKMLVFQI